MSELKVNTISEQSSGNGVTIDSVPVKDGAVGTTTTPITINSDSLNNGQFGGRRNLLYNGSMQIAQRATSATGVGASSGYHTVDRWRVFAEGTSGRLTMTQESITDLEGFSKATKLACTTADTSIAANELLIFSQLLEGYDVQGIQKGFSTAKKVTVSFYVKANASAKYVAELYDLDNSRNNTVAFDVTTNWTKVTINYNADTTGKFDNDSAGSLYFQIWLHGGSNYTGGTFASNTWASATGTNRYAVTGRTSIVDSTARTFFITGVQMEIGDVATPFEHRSFGEELALCNRYFCKFIAQAQYSNFAIGRAYSTSNGTSVLTVPSPMRALPTMTTPTVSGNFTYGHSALTLGFHEDGLFSKFTLSSTASFTANGAYAVEADAADVYIQLDAEL